MLSERTVSRQLQVSVVVLLSTFLLTAGIFVLMPFQALEWAERPFPGFVVEQSLVITEFGGTSWSGNEAGLKFPQRVTHLNGQPVRNTQEFEAAVRQLTPGDLLEVRTVLPDGTRQTFSNIPVDTFPKVDLLRLFWLPYAGGLLFLIMASWVYYLRGSTRPARAFTYFSLYASLASALVFDISTTHLTVPLWTLALTQTGGSLAALALLFPEEWDVVKEEPFLRFVPFSFALFLSLWGIFAVTHPTDPWLYIAAWRAAYFFAAGAVVLFLASTYYRQRRTESATARQQSRMIMIGGAFAFFPALFWLISPVFGNELPWNPVVVIPLLMAFPLSIAFAIVRYRLWDIDLFLNRALTYTVLSALLLMIYMGIVLILQTVFINLTGETSPLAVAISTLVAAAFFHPLRLRVQQFIDKRFFRRRYDAAKTIEAFGASVRQEVDLDNITKNLVETVQETMEPTHINIYSAVGLGKNSSLEIPEGDPLRNFFTENQEPFDPQEIDIDSPTLRALRDDVTRLVVPLISQGELVGSLNLGKRLSEQDYSRQDERLLLTLAGQAAPALRLASIAERQRAEALERQRLENELRLARLIQQALLPKETPPMPGWNLAAHYQPARAVGGDFYDFLLLPDGRVALTVGDVTDKGIPAAIMMATTRSVLRGAARRMLPPGEALARSNELLCPEMLPYMFVTCFYALLDPTTGHMQFANAGHNPPFRCLNHGRDVEELYATGMPLGLMPDVVYEEKEVVLQPGEKLLLYSDGLVEAHNPQREMFGFPRLRSIVSALATQMGDKNTSHDEFAIPFILKEFQSFVGDSWEQEDDVTMLYLEWVGIEETSVTRVGQSDIMGGGN